MKQSMWKRVTKMKHNHIILFRFCFCFFLKTKTETETKQKALRSFRDSFYESAFHVIWCGNILKLPMGNIFGVAELFSPDLELFFWKSARCNEIWIFLPFWQNMLLGWLKNNSKCYGALKKGVWRRKTWKKNVLTCFWPVYLQFDVFFGVSKKSGRDWQKKNFLAKIWFVTCKTWYKSQKKHPLWVKNPAEIQETSFGQGRTFFFKLLLAYTRQLEFISVKLLVLGIISWCSAQIRRDGRSGWAGWASAHPNFGRIEGSVAVYRITTRVHKCVFYGKIISPGVHQLILSSNSRGSRSRWAE